MLDQIDDRFISQHRVVALVVWMVFGHLVLVGIASVFFIVLFAELSCSLHSLGVFVCFLV